MRNKATRCPALLRQIGDRFEAKSVEHVHPADPGRRLKAEVTAKVRKFLVHLYYIQYITDNNNIPHVMFHLTIENIIRFRT